MDKGKISTEKKIQLRVPKFSKMNFSYLKIQNKIPIQGKQQQNKNKKTK